MPNVLIHHPTHKWASLEDERDYWKKLALELQGKMVAIEHVMAGTWSNVTLTNGMRHDRDYNSER
ncbi:MAG: hypothetical protein EKK41_02775 [Hyphomicrobiales bacterium]|nr:MAG: hypothetical protein EKK41_02775 [Hyphomicrobiales bacterium]